MYSRVLYYCHITIHRYYLLLGFLGLTNFNVICHFLSLQIFYLCFSFDFHLLSVIVIVFFLFLELFFRNISNCYRLFCLLIYTFFHWYLLFGCLLIISSLTLLLLVSFCLAFSSNIQLSSHFIHVRLLEIRKATLIALIGFYSKI